MSRWKLLLAASRTPGSWSTRRNIGAAMSSVARGACSSTSTASETDGTMMKAFQFVAAQKPPELREVPVPEPGPGQVLIKIGGAGACHSDLHILAAPAKPGPATAPHTPGHENAGWVEKLGPGTTGFAPGDPVIVYGPWGCGLCMNCRMGRENYCQNRG